MQSPKDSKFSDFLYLIPTLTLFFPPLSFLSQFMPQMSLSAASVTVFESGVGKWEWQEKCGIISGFAVSLLLFCLSGQQVGSVFPGAKFDECQP